MACRLKNGFDHSFSCSNDEGYFASVHDTEDDVPLPPIKKDGSYYSTIAIADYAIKYLKEHAAKYSSQPFFEYLAFHSPHFPIQALPQDIAIYKDRYKSGWDAIREERLERMKKLGIRQLRSFQARPRHRAELEFDRGTIASKNRPERGRPCRSVEHPDRRAKGISGRQNVHSCRHDPSHGHRNRSHPRSTQGDGRAATTRSSSSCPTTARPPSKSFATAVTTPARRWARPRLILASDRVGPARRTRLADSTRCGRRKAAFPRR